MTRSLPLRYVFPLTLLLLCTGLHAQQDYEPGYLVTSDGVRTEVLILNRDWRYSPTEIAVKESADGPLAFRATAELEAFGINGKARYENRTVTLERSSTELRFLTDTPPPPREERILLRVEVAGPATLYSYLMPQLTKFFLGVGDQLPQQLEYIRTLQDGQLYETRRYLKQIATALRCGPDASPPGNLDYTLRALTRIVREYNACTGDPYQVYDNVSANNRSLVLTLNAAAYGSNFQVWQDGKEMFVPNSEIRVVARIGLDVEYVLPFGGNKLALLFRPGYYRFASSGTYSVGKRAYEMTVDYDAIELPGAFRYYSFLTPGLRVFGTVGLGHTLTFGQVHRQQYGDMPLDGMFFLTAEAGLRYRSHWNVAVGYLTHTSGLRNFTIYSRSRGPYLQVGYTF